MVAVLLECGFASSPVSQEMEVLVPTSCVEEQQPVEETKEAEVAMETAAPGVCVYSGVVLGVY